MVGSLARARFALRRGIGAVLLAAALVPAAAATAAAASTTPVIPVSAEERIDALKDRARASASAALATVAGQELVRPGRVREVGFHESGSPTALPMSPAGRLEANDNGGRITLPAVNGPGRGGYRVLAPRGRPQGPTTAVDLSMVQAERVTSPVSGTVSVVSRYDLYGTTPDVLVEIVPEDRPDLAVRMMHIEGIGVQEGDRVEAGRTVVAAHPRLLPFTSQIDRFAGPHPHVHMEVLHRPEGMEH